MDREGALHVVIHFDKYCSLCVYLLRTVSCMPSAHNAVRKPYNADLTDHVARHGGRNH